MAIAGAGAVVTIGKGGVGESGATCQVIHQVTGNSAQVVALRTVATSLCANTGAAAGFVVNGNPEAHGDITAMGSLLRVEANPGDWVVVHVYTVPLFNGVTCTRLGELEFEVQQFALAT